MPLQQKLTGLIFSLLFIIFLVELIRRRKIKEEYAFLWFIVSFVFIAILADYEILEFVTNLFGMGLTSSALFFLGISFLLIYCIFITIKISTISRQSSQLAQEVALLRFKLEEMDQKTD